MTCARLPVDEFADALGARTPSPASGSAAAVAAALAAALVELTARFSGDEVGVDEALRLRRRLLALADEDAVAYAEFARTRSDEARSRIVDVPRELAEAAAGVARLAERLERDAKPPLAADAAVAAILARAVEQAAIRLVQVNLDAG